MTTASRKLRIGKLTIKRPVTLAHDGEIHRMVWFKGGWTTEEGADAFSQILALYPIKGKFTLYYPASPEGAGTYKAVFEASDGEPYRSWRVRGKTPEEAMAKAMKLLVRYKAIRSLGVIE